MRLFYVRFNDGKPHSVLSPFGVIRPSYLVKVGVAAFVLPLYSLSFFLSSSRHLHDPTRILWKGSRTFKISFINLETWRFAVINLGGGQGRGPELEAFAK